MGTAPGAEQYPPVAKTETEKRILATIDEAVKAGELFANVPAADGRMLRLLAESVNARNVIDWRQAGTARHQAPYPFPCLPVARAAGRSQPARTRAPSRRPVNFASSASPPIQKLPVSDTGFPKIAPGSMGLEPAHSISRTLWSEMHTASRVTA